MQTYYHICHKLSYICVDKLSRKEAGATECDRLEPVLSKLSTLCLKFVGSRDRRDKVEQVFVTVRAGQSPTLSATFIGLKERMMTNCVTGTGRNTESHIMDSILFEKRQKRTQEDYRSSRDKQKFELRRPVTGSN